MNLAEAKALSAHLSDPKFRPDWYVWTGGWYENDGEESYYFSHDYLTPDSHVLEIGAYRGAFAKRVLTTYDCWYTGLEPAMTAYLVAVETLKPYPKAEVISMGASDKNEKATLYDVERDSANIFQGPGEEIVSLGDIVDIVEAIGYVDLFVMNCEGLEFRILRRLLDSGLISQVDRLMLQWHDVMPYAFANWIQIESRMAKTHAMQWNLGAWELWSQK